MELSEFMSSFLRYNIERKLNSLNSGVVDAVACFLAGSKDSTRDSGGVNCKRYCNK
ncbi:hypothetical protein HanRHA438_Chr00c19g0851831 [Helianthus annuus]|nr:hypothetical protein HanPSC8_Chr13g0547841 [Helianthus annuus]KAJ0954351.1 hypothetical protein HanRHA438_Chr00c19g0851831 [Helianthus annuus]